MITPRRPTGSTPEALFMQWVYDSLISLRPQNSPGVLTGVSSKGVARSVIQPSLLPMKVEKFCIPLTENGTTRYVECYAPIYIGELTYDSTGYVEPTISGTPPAA